MKTLKGRQLEIASGASNLPPSKVAAYRARWKADGYELPPLPDAAPAPTGPGTEFKGLAESLGMKPVAGCSCAALRAEMDALGVSGCRRDRDRLLKAARLNYAEYSIWAKFKAAVRLPTSGLLLKINPADPVGSLFDEAVRRAEASSRVTGDPSPASAVAVVVPCHNYGRYLGQCLESVLMQSHRPAEVLIVDDGSTDETPEVAQTFGARGVLYRRIDAGNVHDARLAGYRLTQSPLICFIDADDWIGSDYLAEAVTLLAADWRCQIVHTDLHQFGDRHDVQRFPERVTLEDIRRDNKIHAGSMVRREALRVSQALDRPASVNTHADWTMWKRVLSLGGHARKSPAVYHYRRHPSGMMVSHRDMPWFHQANMAEDRITILTPLAGRWDAWRELSAWFERQAWPHDQTAIVLADTSGDPVFNRMVRQWAADCDYTDVRVLSFTVGEQGLADRERHGSKRNQWAVNDAMLRIWSRLAAVADSPWTWTVEDDVIPPDDAAERLLREFQPAVDAVCAPYRSRWVDNYVVHRGQKSVTEPGAGVERVTSAGFGCCLFRTPVLRGHAWVSTMPRWYDPWFFESNGLHLLCNWDCPARHLGEYPQGIRGP